MTVRKNYRNLNIEGQRFGKLVAIKKIENTRTQWLFQCDCGKEVILPASKVFHGQQSCGCLRKQVARVWTNSHITHGKSRTKLYRKYRSILDRCYRKNSKNYKRYGGRGITVCEEWKTSFTAFEEWAYKNGYSQDLNGYEMSLDRIDNNKGYSPDNCRWASSYVQVRNRDITKLYPYKGYEYTASEFADKFGITDKSFVYRRLEKNQSLEYILNDWELIHDVPKEFIEVSQVAEENNVHPYTVKRWICEGKIEGVKIGRKWYVRRN